MYSTADFRKGLKIEIDGELYLIVDFEHHKPGKGSAIVRTRIKNMRDNRTIDKTFRSGDRVNKPDFEETQLQFLYVDGDTYHFMNNASYEQVELNKSFIGEASGFLQENLVVAILYHNNKPVALQLPNFVNLKITRSDPGVKGDTATGATKPATLETGAVVMVPLFVNEGDVIKIDTRTNSYVERVT